MNLRSSACLLLFCLLALVPYCGGQEVSPFNISIYNGLPSNNVYNLTIDHNGFLWLSTDKGVARYDGHNLKVFDLSKGFVNKDIWNLFEDKKGRMWLYSISDNIGYIYNDEYHKIYNNVATNNFYLRYSICDNNDGVFFISTLYSNLDHFKYALCMERNDTLYKTYDIDKYGILLDVVSVNHLVSVDFDWNIYDITVEDDQVRVRKIGQVKVRAADTVEENPLRKMAHERYASFGKHIFSYSINNNYFRIIDIDSQYYRKVYLNEITKSKETEQVTIINMGKDVLDKRDIMLVMTHKHIYEVDSDFNLVRTYNIDSITPNLSGEEITFFIDDLFWGKIVGTFNNGVSIMYNNETAFKKDVPFELSSFQFIGNISDTVSFWFSNAAHTLARVEKNRSITYKHFEAFSPAKIVPFDKDSSVLLSSGNIYKMANGSMGVTVLAGPDYINGRDAIVAGPGEFYVISKTMGFYNMKQRYNNPEVKSIENDRFSGIVYDSKRHLILTYGSDRILVYKKGIQPLIVKNKQLGAIGINSIEKIFIDNTFGNIFIQEENRLLLFEDLRLRYRSLFRNYVLKDAKIFLRNNEVIVAGAFGILFSEIKGPGQLSAPIVYPNIKKMKYSVVYDISVSGNEVLMKTDKGIYNVSIPSATVGDHTGKPFSLSYNMVLTYNKNVFKVKTGDTVNLVKRDSKLLFDIINPAGFSSVKYMYSLNSGDNKWRELNTNELNLPPLSANKFYRLSVIAYDNQWRSNTLIFYLYTVPYWWEKPVARRLIWASLVVLFLMLLYIVVIVTKQIVTKNHAKKHVQLELELKSVYSQINPHFIFNSLGAAMYLIKTKRLDDAYQHIYKFSHLLRAYIKSSRNRFILLSEEIANLRNYIELQQARFNNKFEYEITVEETVNTGVHIPSLLLQPIVENAIKHGLLHKEEKGHLRIIFRKDHNKNEIVCIVDDDGIGRERSRRIKDDMIREESYGNLLVSNLIDIINKYEKMKIEMEYIDKKEPLTGTIVKLIINDLN